MKQFGDHQLYAKFMMDANGCLGLGYDMGTGKTAIALLWLRDALRSGEIEDALVVCPASLVPSWEVAIDEFSDFEGITAGDVAMLKEKVKVTSFQRTYSNKRIPVNHRDGSVSYRRELSLREEVDKRWGAVIVDESHCIGHHDSIQTKACLTLGSLTDHRFIMTATPVHGGGMKENFSKLYGQLKFLDPDVWRNWTEFCRNYVTRFNKWHSPVDYDTEKCRELMRKYYIVCRLEDCVSLPGFIENRVPCPLSEKRIYKDVKEGRISKYDVEVDTPAILNQKLLQICSGSMRNNTGTLTFGTSKDAALEDILDGTASKVVVFCKYTASVDRCADICRKHGRKTVVFDGRSGKPTWKEFQYGDADALVCQYASGGPGLNLQVSSCMVFYEPTRSALELVQATGRIYRNGQTDRCVYHYLYTTDSLEPKVWDAVRAGRDVTDELLNQLARES